MSSSHLNAYLKEWQAQSHFLNSSAKKIALVSISFASGVWVFFNLNCLFQSNDRKVQV
jgi:hypothetical protein